jgi:hypothetical protein
MERMGMATKNGEVRLPIFALLKECFEAAGGPRYHERFNFSSHG